MKEQIKSHEAKMQKTLDVLSKELAAVRAGRANPAVLDKITVEYYGAPTPLNQVAAISTPDPRTLAVQPWDGSVLKAIEKAIQVSDLGINPQNDGRAIRLVFPALTEERRRDLVKQCKTYAEEARVAVRNARRDANTAIEKAVKNDNLPEDESKRAEAEIQKMTDRFVAEVDEVLKKKEAEVMEI